MTGVQTCALPILKSYRASSFYIKHAEDMWLFRKLAGYYLTCVHKRLYRRLPFKDAEGRIGRRYALAVPGTVREITISVEKVFQNKKRQKVNIYINQEKAEEKMMNHLGIENIVLKLQSGNFLNEIVIECPTAINIGCKYNRKLCLKIINCNYEI